MIFHKIWSKELTVKGYYDYLNPLPFITFNNFQDESLDSEERDTRLQIGIND